MTKLITLTVISLVLCSVFSSRCKKEKCKDRNDRNAYKRFTYAVTALSGKYLYQHLLRYPEQSYNIITLPIACIVGHLAYHAEGDDYKQMLKLIGLRNRNEITNVLSTAVSAINNKSDTKSKINFLVLSDNSQKFTESFKQEFIDICNGESGSINYDCPREALDEINKWYVLQSEGHQAIHLKNSNIFSKNKQGIVYATYTNFVASLDHPANPNMIKNIDFEVNKNKTVAFPSLYGAGYFKYAKLDDLDAQVLLMYLKGGNHFVIFFYPNKSENLLKLMKNLEDPKVYYECIDRAKWMCLKVHITMGHSVMSNNLFEFVSELRPNGTDFTNVLKCGKPARVLYGFQQLHLIADSEVREGPMNSELYPGDDLPFVKMSHSCAYYAMNKNGMIIYAGIF